MGTPIDMSILAEMMLEWERRKRELDRLEKAISAQVLELGKTQVVGNVRATYSNGRKCYDYESVGKQAPQEIIAKYTKQIVDWRSVCKEAGFNAVPYKMTEPRVSIKLIG